MKIALTQACLKVKCYFCFSIVADNVILATAYKRNEVSHKAFCTPCFFSKKRAVPCGRYCVAIMSPRRGVDITAPGLPLDAYLHRRAYW